MNKPIRGALTLALLVAPEIASAQARGPIDLSRRPTTLAVIGDTPYGAAQLSDFPSLIAAINEDPDVRTVVHVGDIKTGASRCDTTYYEGVRDLFQSFEDPLLYTPGDNEWTDCHRSRAGKYDPIERLEVIRDLFYSHPGKTLGQNARVVFNQSYLPDYREYVENQMWMDAQVVLSTVHAVGSNNNLDPWFTDDAADAFVDDPNRREAEAEARIEAAIDWLERTFLVAKLTQAKGVALFMQADMWDAYSVANGLPLDGFDRIVQRLAELAVGFRRPVLVVQGDSHRYLVDQPLLNGDVVHNVTVSVPNLTRIVVEGETASEWLKLRIDPRDKAVFSWQRVTR